MFKFEKSKNLFGAYEANRKFTDQYHIRVYVKKCIDGSWRCKAELWFHLCGVNEVVKETQWVSFKSKKSTVKHCNEMFWCYS